jgi:hypothetical protein
MGNGALIAGACGRSSSKRTAVFILRHHPDIAGLMNEIRAFREEMDFSLIVKNLDLYFARLTSRGCLWVEKENGSDEFIPEVRRDVFERFQGLKRGLEMGG